ncbi:Alpha-keto acid-binding periplasmic protein TakP precursor [Grimontia celer]|uniref:Alpha-keto acid-binding periplasmic protein TakP n=1 Tax=Grimontia celer TaxID=1796497 RepID=A0A128F886_9GAMM|nr:TRAP transporter substrate-binding protein [Grimontia celer]CZF82982.1 Alpha-keto acid-binding periplasmic protein TakP precursor [Grimontia celer]
MRSNWLKGRKTWAAVLVGAAMTSVLAAPAWAQEKIRWKVQAVFGTHLPALGDPITQVAEQVDKATDGNIKFKIYEPGKLVPPFGITEAIKNKQIDAGYTWLGYDQGKIPAAALFAAVPFGMEPWEYATWWYEGEGKQLAEELYGKHGVHPVLCSVIGPETAGWFTKEMNSLDDFKGLKIRFAGIGGKVLQKAGASVTVLPGGEIFPALEKGAIDASEFSMPAIDSLMGFDKIAKNNYFPGWHQTFTASHLVINKDVWNALEESTKATIDMACTAGTFRALTRGESLQGEVLAGFEEKGVTARTLNPELLQSLHSLSTEVMQEIADSDPDFKRIYASQQKFLGNYKLWKQMAYLPRDFE